MIICKYESPDATFSELHEASQSNWPIFCDVVEKKVDY